MHFLPLLHAYSAVHLVSAELGFRQLQPCIIVLCCRLDFASVSREHYQEAWFSEAAFGHVYARALLGVRVLVGESSCYCSCWA
jgi:hypothetical protein